MNTVRKTIIAIIRNDENNISNIRKCTGVYMERFKTRKINLTTCIQTESNNNNIKNNKDIMRLLIPCSNQFMTYIS